MNKPEGLDPIEMLRAANPVDPDDLPSASLARVTARIQEDLTMDTPQGASPTPRRLGGLVAMLATAVAAIALVAVVAGPVGRPLPTQVAVVPTATPTEAPASIGPGGGPGMAMCLAYELDILAVNDFGFDGTVVALDDSTISFALNATYKGIKDSTVSLPNPHPAGGPVELESGIDFAVGERYLVTGSDNVIWGCGYSRPYNAADAAEWADAFGG